MVISATGLEQLMNKLPKIILDTDVGDDIDDAFAILLMIQSKAFDILGITTVFRNARQRAHMAKYLVNALGANVPVYQGCDYPIISDPEKLNTEEIRRKEKRDRFGMYQLPQWKDEMEEAKYEEGNAVDFIIEQVHKYPHEVILCGIGPLTNFGIALRKDPTIIPLIKEFRLMSGGRNITFSEWNVYCDPEASYIVYNSGVPTVEIGIDTTHVAALSKQDIEDLKNSNSKAIQVVYEMMMNWFKHYEFAAPVMHDPIAVATIIRPEFCTYEMHPMDIELHNPRGGSIENPNKEHLIKISTGIDVRKFLDYFKSLILN